MAVTVSMRLYQSVTSDLLCNDLLLTPIIVIAKPGLAAGRIIKTV
jgi:hypothetical protein